MKRFLCLVLACTFVSLAPATALAQRASSGHSSAPAPAYHPSAPAYHPSTPAYHPAPAAPVSHPANPNGFGFPPHDVNGGPTQVHPSPVHAPSGYHVAPQQSVVRTYPPHVPYRTGPYRYWRGPVVNNPRRWGGWGWNHHVIWYPVPYYWGGGFWGPWVTGVTGAPLFGSIVDYNDYQIFPSYQAGPSSPGAQLLVDYGLTQTECGPPNLVVIWGPNNSVICAYPNDLVSPGNYELDPATLTLQSLNAPAGP
ncbi:MAG: hypothetical protein ABSD52_07565 [Candidatus Cybelea sp.]